MASSGANLQSTEFSLAAIGKCLDSCRLALLTSLSELAQESALPLYLVGGPVRDLLLGRPVKDLDFAVEGDAPALARRWANGNGGRLVAHRRFGTATVSLGDTTVDLVTARREVYPRPGALPRVTAGSIYDDLARRDFSVNSMALSLAPREPRLLDPQQGRPDLEGGLIRVLHRRSFTDDPTRLLRAARYEQRLNFRLEGETKAQLRAAVAQGCLDTVSGDRLRQEVARTLAEAEPGKALQRGVELGILPAIYAPLGRCGSLRRRGEAVPQFSLDPTLIPMTWLAALAYPLSPEEEEGLIRRLNLPKSWAQVVRDTAAVRQRERELADRSLAPSQLCRLLEGIDPAALYAVAGLADSPAVAAALRRYLSHLRHLAPALKGSDLVALGVPPGPAVGNLLARLRDARLDGWVQGIEEERQWVRENQAAGAG